MGDVGLGLAIMGIALGWGIGYGLSRIAEGLVSIAKAMEERQ